jgi:titin
MDGIFFRMDTTLTYMNYSSFIGGSGDDIAVEAVSDINGDFLICGLTNSTDLPTTSDAYSKVNKGSHDVFISLISPSTPPGVPRDLTVEMDDEAILLKWEPPENNGGSPIINYTIYRAVSDDPLEIFMKIQAKTWFTDMMFEKGTMYSYAVSAVNVNGEGPMSSKMSIVAVTLPDPPTNLSYGLNTDQIELFWEAPTDNGGAPLQGYRIYRNSSSGIESLIGSTDSETLLYRDVNIENGKEYIYKVSCFTANGESNPSDPLIVISSDIPSAPTALEAISGNSSILLTWSSPLYDGGLDIIRYNIYRGMEGKATEKMYFVEAGSNYFNDTNVTNGIEYRYEITAENLEGESPISETVLAVPVTVPDPPGSIGCREGDGFVEITWSEPDDGGSELLRYAIYLKRVDIPDKLIDKVPATSTSFNHTGLTNGRTYTYCLISENRVGPSRKSESIQAVPFKAPSPPMNLDAEYINGSVVLEWDSPSSNGGLEIVGYEIFRGALKETMEIRATVSGEDTSFIDPNVVPGRTYYYKVRANNGRALSALSDLFSFTTTVVPDAPENLSITWSGGRVVLEWDPPAFDGGLDIVGYNIYRKTGQGEMLKIDNVPSDTGSYSDAKVVLGRNYEYLISTQNSLGESLIVTFGVVIPVDPPGPPKDLFGISNGKKVILTWEAPENNGGSEVLEYWIMRSVIDGEMTKINTVIASSKTYEDVNVEMGDSYQYSVRAVNLAGPGENSTNIKVIVDEGDGPGILLPLLIGGLLVIVIAGVIIFFVFIVMRSRRKNAQTPGPAENIGSSQLYITTPLPAPHNQTYSYPNQFDQRSYPAQQKDMQFSDPYTYDKKGQSYQERNAFEYMDQGSAIKPVDTIPEEGSKENPILGI